MEEEPKGKKLCCTRLMDNECHVIAMTAQGQSVHGCQWLLTVIVLPCSFHRVPYLSVVLLYLLICDIMMSSLHHQIACVIQSH